MRVPTSNNSEQMLERINELSARQSRLQTTVSTGQKLFQPEDNPAAVGRVLTLNNEQSALSQYDTNSNYALDWSNATYSGLNSLKSISDRANELATLSVGTVSQSSRDAYAAETDQLIQQASQVANGKLRNDHLFAGTEVTGTATHPDPFELNGTGTYDYWGSNTQMKIPISETSNIAPGTDAPTNLQIRDFLNNLVGLSKALKAGDNTGINTSRASLLTTEDQLVGSLSQQGAVEMRINVSQTQRKDRLDNLQSLVSKETDVDMADAITHLNQASVAYQAALQSTSKIMNLSLLDYLR